MTNQLEIPDETDLIELRELIEEHRRRTGSPVAERMLADWESTGRKFVKVFPADYKRVLAELEAEEAAAGHGGTPESVVEQDGSLETVSSAEKER